MVHFSPNILMRMGWYDISGNKNSETIFSSFNFKDYYEQFNKFYATFLFLEFTKAFKSELKLTRDFNEIVKQIKKRITEKSFCPELITFEELNQKRPGDFIRRFIKLMNEQ